jgi:hypothetical protein
MPAGLTEDAIQRITSSSANMLSFQYFSGADATILVSKSAGTSPLPFCPNPVLLLLFLLFLQLYPLPPALAPVLRHAPMYH